MTPAAASRAGVADAPKTGSVPARRRTALVLMLASGFAALAYQVVWTQQCALWLGHETASVLAVVAAFFGGMALGALALGARVERSAHPARWYAACELAVAAWSVALAWLFDPVGSWLLGVIGLQPHPAWHWATAFGGTFLLLLPATAAMGVTLPALERVLARTQRHGSIAALYASNTLGAVLGVLASAFWLVPQSGLTRTAVFCAAVNLVCAFAAMRLDSGPAPSSAATGARNHRLLALLAITGLLGIGFEVVVVRVLSQVTEDTVYTFALLLAVYLAGTALGAGAYQRFGSATDHADRMRERLAALLAVACLVGAAALWNADTLKAAATRVLGQGMAAALAVEGMLAVAAFGLPTVAMGALFSHLAVQARGTGIPFSRALAANTLGAATAPLAVGVLLIPALGPKATLLLLVTGYLLLAARSGWRRSVVWTPAVAIVALLAAAPPLVFVEVPEGGRVLSYRDGAMAAVSVVEDADGVMRLRIDNRQQEGSSNSRIADARQALLPLLLHPAPQRALFLGLGTGVTAYSAAEDSTLQVDAVELLPEVIAASALFTQALGGAAGPPARLHTVASDARRYVRAAGQPYDVIVSDNFHPARSGSGALYTVEHFRAVRARLAEGGLFCQWLPLHQLDLASLRAIVRSFLVVYPDGLAMIATNSLETPVLGLVGMQARGTDRSVRFDPAQVRRRLASSAFPHRLAEFGLADEFALLGSFVAGPASLVRFAGDAAPNTDDRPVVAYSAPRITYAPESLPRDRLAALLQQLAIAPSELLDTATDAGSQRQLAAYWSARKRYLEVGRNVRLSADVRKMLAQVREPLLSVLRISPDFHPAYDPLLMMASALAGSDAEAARVLLTELDRLQPARPEAAAALRRIKAPAP